MNQVNTFKIAVRVCSDSDPEAIKVQAVLKYLIENGNILEVLEIEHQGSINTETNQTDRKGNK